MNSAAFEFAAMLRATEREWQANAPADWTQIDFRRWPCGFHSSAEVIASTIRWNPVHFLSYPPVPAARAVNALLTRQCVFFAVTMASHVAAPDDPAKPLLAWFNAAVRKHQDDIACSVEALDNANWQLPTSSRLAAHQLIEMWEEDGPSAFGSSQLP